MSTLMPQVPPRPTRIQEQTSSAKTIGSDLPKIPPRPIHRRLERSTSPHRESYARSPLNESPFLTNHGNHIKNSLYTSDSANTSGAELGRPPSVSLPSIGQEGNEYQEIFDATEDLGTSPTQTRSIANDLQLHAPKPSLPTSSAKQRVSTVTRTDSSQAAAFGIGTTTSTGDDKDPSSRPLKAKPSFSSQNSSGTERRPSSALDNEHGIPQIGQIVPMYPNAGDVQAPSPAPFVISSAPGIGFHNDGTKPRNHNRKLSGRGHDIPPDAYGRYGHGVIPHDRFEKAYYEKHPELFKKELGHYGDGRPEWAMSSEDLNKIVRDTASRGAVIGTPSEQIGFQASEEYASRMSSPRLSAGLHYAHTNASETHVDSPLRNESTALKDEENKFEGSLSRSLKDPSELSLAGEDGDVIHVDAPCHRTSKILGGYAHADSTENLGPHTGEAGESDIRDEHGYGAPILASDEVAKEPFGYELQPAVSPMNERRGSGFYDDSYHRSSSQPSSRPSSRPGSIHGTIHDYVPSRSRPLEDLEEYEPLFPEEEKRKAEAEATKPLTVADRLKRPELKNRKFPSQDIWEDTPNSLQYTATVSTPQLPEDEEAKRAREANETPAQAFARKQEELAERESKSPDSFLHVETEKKPWANKSHLTSETRPGLKQRFPSRDIWEDTPDSLQLQTTVGGPQSEDKDILSPPEERPTTGGVAYHQEKAAAGVPMTSEEGRATTGIAAIMKPTVPARPTKSKLSQSLEKSQSAILDDNAQRAKQGSPIDGPAPPLPMKTKPQVPARPSKPASRESSENVPLAQVPSNSSAKSADSEESSSIASNKPKPPVPSRPMGSKIAALQGGFMSDLNKRLQLGPQAPKKDDPTPEEEAEEVKEKAPLSDARKGRARGPARRAPAKSPAPVTAASAGPVQDYSFTTPSTLWTIDPAEDLLHVISHEAQTQPTYEPSIAKQVSQAPSLATNTAGQQLTETNAPTAEPENESKLSGSENIPAEMIREAERTEIISESDNHSSAPTKPSDEPEVREDTSGLAAVEPDEEDLSASTATIKAHTAKDIE